MKYNYESGRSMVEMLGTLAIIGVLSIGGIVGYSYGIDKYRANKTMHDIQLRAVDLLAQIQNKNDDLTLDSWKNEQTLYPMSVVFDDESNDPLIQVSNVPERVCEMIVKGMETQAAITVNSYYIEGQEDGGCEEINDLTFYFGDYEACGTDYCSGDTAICHPDTQTCVECLNSGDCPSDKPVCNASNACEPCPDETPVWDSVAGQCTGCTSHDDCSDGKVCLPRNKKCTSYEVVDIEGTDWVQIIINLPLFGIYSHWKDALFMCDYLGMEVPEPNDFATGWDGKTLTAYDTFVPLTPTSDGLAMENLRSGPYEQIWTNQSRGVGTGLFWEYYIDYLPSKKGFYNSSEYARTVCKPR